jgi:BlaI family penicillinase repressor
MNPSHKLGDLQLAIMRVIWERGEAAASEVHQALLAERGLAITTIKTMLRKLEERGVVEHRENGRQFVYRSAVDESDVREGMVGDLIKRMFAGDGSALINHLVQAGEIDADELDALKAHVAKKRKRGKR